MIPKICIAGKIACGKSTVSEVIVRHFGFPRVSFGDILRKYSRTQGLPQTREALQNLGQKILDQYGYDGFLKWAMDNSPDTNWNGPLIIDGLRHIAVYEHIVELFPETILVYCKCDMQTQISRIVSRDKITKEEAIKIVSHSTERYIQELESYAHIVYRTDSDMQNIIGQLDKLIQNFCR
ncbi:AAA family ATPase [Patescibacteria group bacterium]|nr:AAA family ATPase [Patescibacteria group bacterium]MBU4580582.1 AAA family ATPase [Patescibacteria group bacterium]